MKKHMLLDNIKKDLRRTAKRDKALTLLGFFKTGPGEYGEGDIFIGVTVPEIRKTAKKYFGEIPDKIIRNLLHSPVHEERMLALLCLVLKFSIAHEKEKKRIYELYLKNTRCINSWDLVDISAPHIVGSFLERKSKAPLFQLARSPLLWDRRIAIVATMRFIKNGEYAATLKICRMLISDKEDLIHKAAGWMLREVGKKDRKKEEEFLKKTYKQMPRTMLRYAIEKFPEAVRKKYLNGGY